MKTVCLLLMLGIAAASAASFAKIQHQNSLEDLLLKALAKKTAEEEDGVYCAEDEYTCINSDRCIYEDFVCDGEEDCEYGDDEENCVCKDDEYSCRDSSLCINETWVCDGEEDCPNGDDEDNCEEDDSGCEYTKYDNTYYRHPYEPADVWGNVDDCKKSCEMSPYSCWGFDYNVNQDSCKMMLLANWNPTDQFIKCEGDDCSEPFTKHQATVSPGGVKFNFDLWTCGSFCMDDDSCLGFDYDYGYGICYIHNDTTILAQSKTSTGGDHYTRVQCDESESEDCTDTFEKIAKKYSFNSVPRPQANTVEKCSDLCLASDECDGIDFDNDWNVCLLDEREHVPLPRAYERQDDDSFEAMDGVYSFMNGDYQNIGFQLSLTTCQDICLVIDDGACGAVLYDHKDGSCWTFADEDDMQEIKTNHYVRHCSE